MRPIIQAARKPIGYRARPQEGASPKEGRRPFEAAQRPERRRRPAPARSDRSTPGAQLRHPDKRPAGQAHPARPQLGDLRRPRGASRRGGEGVGVGSGRESRNDDEAMRRIVEEERRRVAARDGVESEHEPPTRATHPRAASGGDREAFEAWVERQLHFRERYADCRRRMLAGETGIIGDREPAARRGLAAALDAEGGRPRPRGGSATPAADATRPRHRSLPGDRAARPAPGRAHGHLADARRLRPLETRPP